MVAAAKNAEPAGVGHDPAALQSERSECGTGRDLEPLKRSQTLSSLQGDHGGASLTGELG